MRISWFRPAPAHPAERLDDIPPLLAALGHTHDIDVVTEADAHDFVWKQFREPNDVCVYEVGCSQAHRFIWPYLFHYPGVLLLRQTHLHDSRAASLEQDEQSADYAAEFLFNHGHPPRPVGRLLPRGGWPMLRAPLLASRLAVVDDVDLVHVLQEEHPDARLRHVPLGVDAGPWWESGRWVGSGAVGDRPEPAMGSAPDIPAEPAAVRFAVFGDGRRGVVERALMRAAQAGEHVALVTDPSPAQALAQCDVVLALTWPAAGEPLTPALAGMAARKPVVTFEVEATAGWPALDPQTWRPRGVDSPGAPIVVSIDPRDDEHSLMVAMRRLGSDASLRASLADAGHAWWLAHGTLRHAADAWLRVLEEARSLTTPPHPPDWPAHLAADGTNRVRAILGEMGTSVDFLPE